MKKFKKLTALLIAVIVVVGAFAPAALAWTKAPYNWSSWPLQKQNSFNAQYTKVIQRYANICLSSNLPITGNFYGGTYTAVCGLQGYLGVTVDGKVGPNTWAAMYNDAYNEYLSHLSLDERLHVRYNTVANNYEIPGCSYIWSGASSAQRWTTNVSTTVGIATWESVHD